MLSTTRLLAAGGVLTLAVGLATAPSASAATGLTYSNPRATPTPSNYLGVQTDACDSTTTPQWIRNTGETPTLSVNVNVPAGVTTVPTISVTDETTAPFTSAFQAAAPVVNGIASVQVPNLKDGHSYSWRAWSVTGGMPSASAKCHFRVDTTLPTVSVSSTDFPASGSGLTPTKYAGQTGTFVINGSDAASGIACYYVSLQATPGFGGGCSGPNAVKPGPDGSATIQLKPTDWGSNILQVEADDVAGNATRYQYSFYAPSNPHPPQALGDIDNDGVPDILLPDAAGNLQVISGGSGTTTPTTVIPAGNAPGGAGWTNIELSHRGWSNTAPADTVFARNLASVATRGGVYVYRNQGTPGIESGRQATSAGKPSSCQDLTGATITCPADVAWSGADQMVALGPVDPQAPTAPSLLAVEHGDLWLFAHGDLLWGEENATKLTTAANWAGYDLIAPGPDAQGNLALWARDRATGELHAYPLPKKADGTIDFSALADPTAHVVASGFTTAAYPTLGSSGDLNGDGTPDLYGVTADRHLVTFSGWSNPKDLGALQ